MRKILVICAGGLKNDGITSWFEQIVFHMDRHDLQIDTIAWPDTNPQVVRRIKQLGVSIVNLPNRQSNVKSYSAALRSLLDVKQYDVMHVCGSSALMAIELNAAKHAGIRTRIAHSHNTTCMHPVMDRILRPYFYRLATDYVACGTDAGKWLFNKHAFTVIPNGKNLHEFAFSAAERAAKRKELGIESSDIVVGHIGRFNKQKNHKQLLDIFSELYSRKQDYRLCLIGDDGGLFDSTQQLVKDLSLADRVIFLGRREDVPQLLNVMDGVIFPSLYEGFPNVVLEWQLNGLPIVMSDVITEECIISPLVTSLSLNDDASVWANTFEENIEGNDRSIASQNACQRAKVNGFDIIDDAKKLRSLYEAR